MYRPRVLLFGVIVLLPSAASPQGNPVGPEFRVNTYTMAIESFPDVARDAAGPSRLRRPA